MIKESLVQVLVTHKVKSGNASLMAKFRGLGDVVADLPMFIVRISFVKGSYLSRPTD